MLSLHTNAAALTAQNSVGGTQKALSTSMTRLGTGFRVNSAMDDAAGLQIATRLSAQTRGMAVAQRNAQNGISMMQTAEGAFTEITNILLRMKDLATEARNGASNTDDKTAMDAEYQELGSELGNILNNTKFGGQALLNGAGSLQAGAITYQIGAAAAETMSVERIDRSGRAGDRSDHGRDARRHHDRGHRGDGDRRHRRLDQRRRRCARPAWCSVEPPGPRL